MENYQLEFVEFDTNNSCSISPSMFETCKNLLTVIGKIKNIGSRAFMDCKKLIDL